MINLEYSKIKLIAWRFGRVFLAAFLAEVALHLEELSAFKDLYPMLLLPALIAGISAVSKAIREYLADDEYESILHKLPV